MLESEQLIEAEATLKRGRRCSLSLKDRPGRETCRKSGTATERAQQRTPRSAAGNSEDHAASLARILSADGLDQARKGGSSVLATQSAPMSSPAVSSSDDLAA